MRVFIDRRECRDKTFMDRAGMDRAGPVLAVKIGGRSRAGMALSAGPVPASSNVRADMNECLGYARNTLEAVLGIDRYVSRDDG